jgi:hypothetical protein
MHLAYCSLWERDLELILKAKLQIRQLHLESGRQIVLQVSSQSPVVGMRHEVHYSIVWVYTEARTVLRAVVTGFLFTVGVWSGILFPCVSLTIHNRQDSFDGTSARLLPTYRTLSRIRTQCLSV